MTLPEYTISGIMALLRVMQRAQLSGELSLTKLEAQLLNEHIRQLPRIAADAARWRAWQLDQERAVTKLTAAQGEAVAAAYRTLLTVDGVGKTAKQRVLSTLIEAFLPAIPEEGDLPRTPEVPCPSS